MVDSNLKSPCHAILCFPQENQRYQLQNSTEKRKEVILSQIEPNFIFINRINLQVTITH